MSIREMTGFIICGKELFNYDRCGLCIHYHEDNKCHNPRINQIITYLKAEIEKMENPFENEVKAIVGRGGHRGSIATEHMERRSSVYSQAIQDMVKLLEEK